MQDIKAVNDVDEFLRTLSGRMIDLLIYGAVAVCFLLGMAKCVLPLRQAARLFRLNGKEETDHGNRLLQAAALLD